jgi:aquaporin Z
LNVAVAPWKAGTALPGLPIGSVVVVGAATVGSISGGAFNPAVGIGPTVLNNMINHGPMDKIWIPIVGPFLGALAAYAIYTIMGGQDKVSPPDAA